MELKDYNWSTTCFICGKKGEKEEMMLISSIVPLEKYPNHADPEYIHTYPVCPECLEKGELV